jgi:hypothetical protein
MNDHTRRAIATPATDDTETDQQTTTDTPAAAAKTAGAGRALSAREWGRIQAAKAPRFSAERRRRIAALLGLTLPPEPPAEPTSKAGDARP